MRRNVDTAVSMPGNNHIHQFVSSLVSEDLISHRRRETIEGLSVLLSIYFRGLALIARWIPAFLPQTQLYAVFFPSILPPSGRPHAPHQLQRCPQARRAGRQSTAPTDDNNAQPINQCMCVSNRVFFALIASWSKVLIFIFDGTVSPGIRYCGQPCVFFVGNNSSHTATHFIWRCFFVLPQFSLNT